VRFELSDLYAWCSVTCAELHVHDAMLVIAAVESLLTYIHYTHAVKAYLFLH